MHINAELDHLMRLGLDRGSAGRQRGSRGSRREDQIHQRLGLGIGVRQAAPTLLLPAVLREKFRGAQELAPGGQARGGADVPSRCRPHRRWGRGLGWLRCRVVLSLCLVGFFHLWSGCRILPSLTTPCYLLGRTGQKVAGGRRAGKRATQPCESGKMIYFAHHESC